MSGDTYFTITEVAQKLDVGVSTVKLWIKRYAKWLPTATSNNEIVFPQITVETFQLISECTSSGMEAAAIEEILNDTLDTAGTGETAKNETGHSSGRSLLGSLAESTGIDTILLQILDQQKIIASAQDRRATAEERKAFALESRAEAELLKANVMQEMLTVMKEQSVQNTVSSLMDRIQQMPGPSKSEFEFDFEKNLDDLQELTESIPEATQPEPSSDAAPKEEPDVEEPDDLQESIDTAEPEPPEEEYEVPPVETEDVDDLSLLIEPQEIETDISEEDDIDDLSLLIDPEQSTGAHDDVDDLSLLIDDIKPLTPEPAKDVDDLSALIDQPGDLADDDIDDLSFLISEPSGSMAEDIDDLSLLIDEQPDGSKEAADDLSVLADTADSNITEDVDDLSLLIDPPAPPATEKEPAEQPTAGDHKSQVLSKIIKMKEKDGLSIDETTRKLNDEGVKTLSGKGEWDTKTIAGIYKYIDSGKQKK